MSFLLSLGGYLIHVSRTVLVSYLFIEEVSRNAKGTAGSPFTVVAVANGMKCRLALHLD